MKVHQNIVIDGVDLGDRTSRKNSKFCNEGKWDNFVDPLLPNPCFDMAFVEMGCNAGLFLKMAKEKGFHTVVGVDMVGANCDAAVKYRDSLGMDYKVLNRTLGNYIVGTSKGGIAINPNSVDYVEFNFDEIPVADVTLLANFHYHLDINTFLMYLDRLRYKTRYCIVVSAKVRSAHWKAHPDMNSLRVYFKEWEEVGSVYPPSTEGDPHKREMFSMLFKSPVLGRVDIDTVHGRGGENATRDIELAEMVRDCDFDLIPMDTSYYKNQLKLRSKWSQEEVDAFVGEKINLLYDVKRNGMREPLLVRSDNMIIDGGHRLLMYKVLGRQGVIVRTGII